MLKDNYDCHIRHTHIWYRTHNDVSKKTPLTPIQRPLTMTQTVVFIYSTNTFTLPIFPHPVNSNLHKFLQNARSSSRIAFRVSVLPAYAPV